MHPHHKLAKIVSLYGYAGEARGFSRITFTIQSVYSHITIFAKHIDKTAVGHIRELDVHKTHGLLVVGDAAHTRIRTWVSCA